MIYDFHTLGSQLYVYELAYPESMGSAVFYVGKGQCYRITAHEREARKGVKSHKCNIIREIWMHGDEVVKRIIAVFPYYQEREALMYEWAMINMTCHANQLVNKRSGTCLRKINKRIAISLRIEQIKRDGAMFA